jgi:cysteinyl-tRNA synthetase
MAQKHLGFSFDIHGGGLDLVFPHHENEIAQSEAATESAPFARYWLHNGMLNLGGEKMAKSVGNVFGLLDALRRWDPKAVRLFYLRKHYRAPLDFSAEAIDDAGSQLERMWAFRRRVGELADEAHQPTMARFEAAMDDDFNTAEALAALFDAIAEGNRSVDAGEDAGPFAAAYDEIVGVLGLTEPVTTLDDLGDELSRLAADFGITHTGPEEAATALLARRDQARAGGDYATADFIRDRLAGIGIVLEDTADGSRWHRR